ncbi:class I SAM-dependent methyltransferase [Pseudomonas sp. Eth.TT006]
MSPALRREHQLARTFVTRTTAPGELDRFIEPRGPGLHHLFILRLNDGDWVGRKILQHREPDGWHLSSALKPWMLLGPLLQWHWGDQGLLVDFRAVSAQQQQAAFQRAQASTDSELYFPFPAMDEQGREFVCPAEYWQCDAAFADQLNADEQHLREYCADLIKTFSQPGMVIHDPACSTGEFIATLAQALPDCVCLGSDRSASMIEHARHRHRASTVRFSLADARDTAADATPCDVLILRFLNAEVMTREEAAQLLRDMAARVRPQGTILLFGHTPVLPAVPFEAQALKLQLLSSTAARTDHNELFQFYRLRRLEPC